MKFILIVFSFLILTSAAFAQKVNPNPEVHEIESHSDFEEFPEVEAKYPYGNATMQKYLTSNFNFPDSSMDLSYSRAIYVSFIVEVDGSISMVKIERSMAEELDTEVMRVVKNMPKWIPAEHGGKRVRSKVLLPIRIHLN